MFIIHSQMAKSILKSPKSRVVERVAQMRKYPGDECGLWVFIEKEGSIVKNLSYAGDLSEQKVLILETLAALLKDKSLALLENLSLRECEAYLRDRNSRPALEGLTSDDEIFFKKLTGWMRSFPTSGPAVEYQYSFEKGPFKTLKLVDKIKEIKAFLNSAAVVEVYHELARPELIDVDELTVYLLAPYQTEKERAAFHELHLMGVATFQEENLNFIPEG